MTIREKIERAKQEEFLTVEQVSLLLNFHRITIYKKAAKKEIPGLVRFGRSLRFKRVVVLAWGDNLRRRDRPGGQVANYQP